MLSIKQTSLHWTHGDVWRYAGYERDMWRNVEKCIDIWLIINI